jgi:hypothetical protein
VISETNFVADRVRISRTYHPASASLHSVADGRGGIGVTMMLAEHSGRLPNEIIV